MSEKDNNQTDANLLLKSDSLNQSFPKIQASEKQVDLSKRKKQLVDNHKKAISNVP